MNRFKISLVAVLAGFSLALAFFQTKGTMAQVPDSRPRRTPVVVPTYVRPTPAPTRVPFPDRTPVIYPHPTPDLTPFPKRTPRP